MKQISLLSHSYYGSEVWGLLRCIDLDLRISHKVAVKMSVEIWWRPDNLFRRWLVYMVIEKRPQFFAMWERTHTHKSPIFHDSIYIEVLEITKVCIQSYYRLKLPTVCNKNRNEEQRRTRELPGWKFVVIVTQQGTF